MFHGIRDLGKRTLKCVSGNATENVSSEFHSVMKQTPSGGENSSRVHRAQGHIAFLCKTNRLLATQEEIRIIHS